MRCALNFRIIIAFLSCPPSDEELINNLVKYRYCIFMNVCILTRSYGTRSLREHLMAWGVKWRRSTIDSPTLLRWLFTAFSKDSVVLSSLEKVSKRVKDVLEKLCAAFYKKSEKKYFTKAFKIDLVSMHDACTVYLCASSLMKQVFLNKSSLSTQVEKYL